MRLLTNLEGSVGTSLALKMTGKGDKKQTIKSGIKSPIGSIQESSESKNFSEDKLDHDNLYLLLEQHFIGHKLLNEITDVSCLENSESQIIKITAPTRFFDWSMIHKLLENPNSLRLLMLSSGVDPSEVLPDEVLELMLCNNFSLFARMSYCLPDGVINYRLFPKQRFGRRLCGVILPILFGDCYRQQFPHLLDPKPYRDRIKECE